MHNVLPYSDSCMYWCLAYIREGISDLRIYVAVTSLYPRNRDITSCKEYVGNRVEGIYLEEVVSCDAMSLQVFALASPCVCNWSHHAGRSSFEHVCHELDMLFLEDVSHVK